MRYIFKLCYDGLGPTQIAKKLKVEKVLTPTAYKTQKDGKLLPAEPYKWAQKTVAGILEKLEYIGHTENFKTTSKNYRSKKRVWNEKENRRIFEDTHPAIVDRHIFETVQEIRKHKRRPTAPGKISIFRARYSVQTVEQNCTTAQQTLSKGIRISLFALITEAIQEPAPALYPSSNAGQIGVSPHSGRAVLYPAV